ncbi:hypothetical protein C8T65DRAFT_671938 [Cerioporus squamosus]|nr:hypothetical protein C8T65DRAFT_671938 [Cerioporus squamosus]
MEGGRRAQEEKRTRKATKGRMESEGRVTGCTSCGGLRVRVDAGERGGDREEVDARDRCG